MEAEILIEIKDSEKKADEIIERAKKEKEEVIHKETVNSSMILAEKQNEIRRLQEKKVINFRENAKLITEEKLAEGKIAVKQAKTKSEKNIAKAVDFVIKKFEEVI